MSKNDFFNLDKIQCYCPVPFFDNLMSNNEKKKTKEGRNLLYFAQTLTVQRKNSQTKMFAQKFTVFVMPVYLLNVPPPPPVNHSHKSFEIDK